MLHKTISEQLVEDWFDRHQIEWRRIRVAITRGNRRPDYAIRVGSERCIVEVKELTPNDEDKRLIENARAGTIEARWVEPGKRLRRPIRDGEHQLRKFSARRFATIICLFDATASFHDADFHYRAALYGDETLRFVVPEGADTALFVGSGPGRNAMLRHDERATVSAVAVLRRPAGSDSVVDLYHNPFAAIPIDPALAAPFVRRQVSSASDKQEPKGPTWFDVRDNPEYADFFIDPDAAMERIVREILDKPKTPQDEA
jgi:hypothetical protein